MTLAKNPPAILIPFGARNIVVTLDEEDPDGPITLEVEPHPDTPGDTGYSVGLHREDALAVAEALLAMARHMRPAG